MAGTCNRGDSTPLAARKQKKWTRKAAGGETGHCMGDEEKRIKEDVRVPKYP